MTKVIIAGYQGKMGQKAVAMVQSHADFELVAVYGPKLDTDVKLEATTKVFNQLDEINVDADVWVDFTTPTSVYENTKFALEHGYSPVIGTTGLTDDQLTELKQIAKKNNIGGLIAPNFGISAVLLMQFAKQAAKYMPDVEIIEMHHDQKLDAPSGTALSTAKLISEVRKPHEQGNPEAKETLANVRGGDYNGIRIHAVRLPGLVAHEQVLFGSSGEGLTIRQDTLDRQSFMSGVAIAIEKITNEHELLVGLENLL
ncbi:dihydrodipicolinate reductase [Paucilactobacillus hokkaidonensis JCM 18461]|uniref:4-hydroxy-tetrahydrodipicolinate reductase n=2 Tax=Paucilactobacillus hokkaidonensis TaxID=1193095 RepID=A0A0A1GYY5_9LACO|nr:4-hydroxy-tetrahydrodipicolinate reductase [Paucilactobacillus hokkaidonensis]KRO10684.1 dihydrodipicolinate reductase [Paucilactobacillus hokkaidonensis]BAP85676.1 dihydrodipicolinate reductase [Paucilactobacillus hokkaidonensis JCM 18461]